MERQIFWKRAVWIPQVILAAVFLFFGAAKLFPHNQMWIELFEAIGIGQWFRYFTGGLEVICGILLLTSRFSAPAALLLICTMIGAIITRLFILHDSVITMAVPILCLIGLLIIVWIRRDNLPKIR